MGSPAKFACPHSPLGLARGSNLLITNNAFSEKNVSLKKQTKENSLKAWLEKCEDQKHPILKLGEGAS